MTISQERNADNMSELPGVAASRLSRNKAFLTDRDEEVRKENKDELRVRQTGLP